MINQKGWTFVGDFYAPCNYPLAIQLTKFEVQCFNTYVQLNWETASETNNAYFIIERSQDGKIWNAIATIDGKGDTDKTLFYQTLDYAPLSGSSFYRLKQIDFDGAFNYSPIRKINRNNSGNSISLYPNPVKGRATLEVGIKGTASVFNVFGKEIIKVNIVPGKNLIDFGNLSSGIYFISIDNTVQYKFIKE